MKIKSKEIAKALGLSTATVSLALNNKPGVNENTRQKVREYLESCEGRTKESAFIKWVVYVDVRENFSGEVRTFFKMGYESGIQQFQKAGLEVKLIYAYNEEELAQILEISNIDGTSGMVLRCDEINEKTFRILDRCLVPMALEDGYMAKKNGDVINFGNRSAVFEGMDYLKKRGMRNVVYLGNSYQIYNFDSRRRAYKEYLTLHPELQGAYVEVGSQLEVIDERLEKYLKQNKPDALFLENYFVSMGTAKTLERMGIRVPHDISLLGIDAMPETMTLPYTLTHFAVPHSYRSYYTAELLLQRMTNEKTIPGREVFMREEMVEGSSVKE